MPGILGGSPEEVIEAYVHRAMAASDEMPLCELMTFSGSPNDWRKDGNHILLRLTGRHCDDAGQPYEVWARLVAPAGRWVIPTVPTEMIVLCPPHLWRMAGAPWALHGAQLPPGKVDQETAYEDLGDGVTLLQKMGGWALKAGDMMIGIQAGTGQTQIASISKGTHIALDPVANAIELAVQDGNGKTLAMLRLDETGISMAGQKSDGSQKHTWKLDSDSGDFVGVGTGKFFAVYGNGGLGKAPTIPIGNPTAVSVSWGVSP